MIDLWDAGEISEADGEMFHDDWRAALKVITTTPARTHDGVKAKAAVLATAIRSLTGGTDLEADNRLALSLAADIAGAAQA